MTALDEARSVLNRLSIPERQSLLKELAHTSAEVAPGVFKTPDVCGGDACIRNSRIPVWLLEEARRGGASDSELLSLYPNLSSGDLKNAWAYVASNGSEIDGLIFENSQA